MRVTDLDRNGVINEDKLQECHPELAKNLRHNLGVWISEEEHRTTIKVAVLGVAVTGLNLFVLLVCRIVCTNRAVVSVGTGGDR